MVTSTGNVNFKHCFHAANTSPQELVKFSFCNKCSDGSIDEPPGCIVNTLANDPILIQVNKAIHDGLP